MLIPQPLGIRKSFTVTGVTVTDMDCFVFGWDKTGRGRQVLHNSKAIPQWQLWDLNFSSNYVQHMLACQFVSGCNII